MPVREAEEAAPEPGAPVPVREAEEEAGAANSAAPKWVSRARRPGSDTTTAEGETRPWLAPAWWRRQAPGTGRAQANLGVKRVPR